MLSLVYGGPQDVVIPALAGLAFLASAAYYFLKRGAAIKREIDYSLFKVRLLPERFDNGMAIASSLVCLAMAAMFFGILISVVAE
jgi:hypothetical protein